MIPLRLLVLPFLLIPHLVLSQSLPQFIVNGEVVDENGLALPYVEIGIYRKDTLVLNHITDVDGKLNLQLEQGNYTLVGSHFGSNLFTLDLDLYQNTDLGKIMAKTSIELDEVVLSGKKALIEKKPDRLLFNVENSIVACGGDALDVLKRTPSIQVQNENIKIIGRGEVKVMINDRMVELSGEALANYLRTIPSDDIKTIEVITIPPAKYAAEGNSGLINIVLKNVQNEQWSGSLRSVYQQATYAKGNFGGSFNMQKNKFRLNTSVGYINGSSAAHETNKIHYPDHFWDEINDRRDFTNVLTGKLGMEYQIDRRLSTGFIFNFMDSKPFLRETDRTWLSNPLNGVVDSVISTLATNKLQNKLNSLNYHFVYDIDSIGKKLTLDFDFFKYKNQINRTFDTESFFPNNQPIPNSIDKAKNYGEQAIQNYSVNLDMEHPTQWVSLNYGSRISFTKTDNLFDYFDIIDNQEIINSNFSNRFNYQENTQAVYLSAQKELSEKWEAKIGLRYEITQTKGHSQTMNQTNTNNYSKLFPTAYIVYTPNDKHTFNIKYGSRISRPSFYFLNPFRFVNNPYSYAEGNPFLQPAFINNIAFEYAYKDNFITEVFYSYTDDDYEQVTLIDSNTHIQQVIPLNFIKNKTFGINQMVIFKVTKWWDADVSAHLYYTDTRSKIPVTLQYLSGWNAEFSISNDITLNQNKTLFFNTNLWFITKGVDNLDYSSDDLQLNVSFKWFLLNKDLIISLNVQDIINPKGMKYTSFSNNIKNSFQNYYDEQYFGLGIIYNFGEKFNTNNREHKNREEQNRAF